MPSLTLPYHGPSFTVAILRATRADMRASRQILAELGYGGTGSALDRVIAGPLRNISGFLAGCGVCFVLIAWDESGRRHARGGPCGESVGQLVSHLLSRESDDPPRVTLNAAGHGDGGPGYRAGGRVGDRGIVEQGEDACLRDLTSEVAALRRPWIESALGVLVEGLRDREVSFLLAWRLPGESQARLDHSLGADRRKIEDYLRWFVRERLGDCDAPADVDNNTPVAAPATGVPSP